MSIFIRAVSTKEHKANFFAAAESTITAINELKKEYESVWESLEGYRKERAALIEDIIKAVKEGNIKIRKQLCRCDNAELNEVLEEVVDGLTLEQQELIKCSLVKINIRYKQIDELGKKLEDLAEQLSQYRTVEPDYDEEVVVDFSLQREVDKDDIPVISDEVFVRENKPREVSEEDSDLEEIVDSKPADESVVISIESFLAKKQNDADLVEPDLEEDSIGSIIEEDDLRTVGEESDLEKGINLDEFEAGDPSFTVTGGIEETELSLEDVPEDLEEYEEETLEESDECINFVIENNITLKEISARVYSSGDYWEALYNYGKNKERIDRIAAEHNVSYHVVCNKPGYLNGVTLQFPIELVTYEVVPSDEVAITSKRLVA